MLSIFLFLHSQGTVARTSEKNLSLEHLVRTSDPENLRTKEENNELRGQSKNPGVPTRD